jgi:hypothetical protein
LFAIGAIGFGTLQVIGLSLVPKPPAIMTACIISLRVKILLKFRQKYEAILPKLAAKSKEKNEN